MNWILERRTPISALIFVGCALLKLAYPNSEFTTLALLAAAITLISIDTIPTLATGRKPRVDGVVILVLCWILTAAFIAVSAWETRGP